MTATSNRGAVLSVVGAALLFGTSATAVELLVPQASAQSVAGWRLLVGALGLIAVTRGLEFLQLYRLPVTWLMGISVAAFQFFFFLSASINGVAVGTLVTISAAPWFSGLLGWAWGAGKPSRTWWISTALGIIGVFMLVGISGTNDIQIGGTLAGLAAALSYAVMTNSGTRLAAAGHHPTHILAASFAIGAVLLLPFVVAGGGWVGSVNGVLLVLWVGLGVTTLAYVLFGVGLKHLMPGTIATLNLAEPLLATLLAVVVLGEQLTLLGWLGCLLIVIALSLLARAASTPTQHPDGRIPEHA